MVTGGDSAADARRFAAFISYSHADAEIAAKLQRQLERYRLPKHADAWASLEELDGGTKVTLAMTFSTAAEYQNAKGFGAVELGLQTLGKLARFIGSD